MLPYCWRDETPLSNHELRMDDDVYKMRQDQSVTVTFPLTARRPERSASPPCTRSPGRRPRGPCRPTSRSPSVPTSVRGPAGRPARRQGRRQPTPASRAAYLLAADLVGAYAKDLGYGDAAEAPPPRAAITSRRTGAELEGVQLRPLWDYYADAETWGTENAWRILVADYVTTGDGTGIVHQAPAYGEDDQRVCEAAGIPVILSVDDGGSSCRCRPR